MIAVHRLIGGSNRVHEIALLAKVLSLKPTCNSLIRTNINRVAFQVLLCLCNVLNTKKIDDSNLDQRYYSTYEKASILTEGLGKHITRSVKKQIITITLLLDLHNCISISSAVKQSYNFRLHFELG